jgi:hypothetical protein
MFFFTHNVSHGHDVSLTYYDSWNILRTYYAIQVKKAKDFLRNQHYYSKGNDRRLQ